MFGGFCPGFTWELKRGQHRGQPTTACIVFVNNILLERAVPTGLLTVRGELLGQKPLGPKVSTAHCLTLGRHL